jgi:hypothetical protein
VIFFKPRRLWVSSANFTRGSRDSLEFGYWTEDDALVHGAERFLTSALRYSERLDPDSDFFKPDLAPVLFDDEAFADVVADMNSDDDDQDNEAARARRPSAASASLPSRPAVPGPGR